MGVKLGQKWAVKDGNLLASNQVGSRFFNKEFDFSRASNGTYIDRDGLLKTAELYNLVPYSEDFSGYTNTNSTDEANATISPSGVKNATSFLEAATTGQHKLTTSFSFDGSSTYTFSIYAKTNGRDLYIDTQNSNEWGGRAWFDLTEGTANSVLGSASIQDVGNGWYRCIVTGASILSGGNLIELLTSNGSSNSTTGDTTKGVYIYGAQLVEGTEPLDYQYTNGLQGLPRISFEDGVGHLLLEPQRTNLITHSEYVSGITTIRATINLDSSQPSPTNDLGVYYLTATSANGLWYYPLYTSGNGVFSVYLKRKTGVGNVKLSVNGGVNYTNVSVTNEWKRFSISTASGLGQLVVNCETSGDEVYLWGLQAEEASYPTSYIKTEGTSVTRLADVCNNSGSAQDFNNEGVLYAEIARFKGDTTSTTLSINDGSNSNMVTFYYFSTNVIYFDILSSSPNVSAYTTIDDTSNLNKIALKYKSGDIALWVNGQELITRTNIISLSGLNELSFSYGNNTSPFYGKVRNVQVFTEALSDAELQQLTT